MTDRLRAAAQAALEAITELEYSNSTAVADKIARDAKQVLRTALAEQQQEPKVKHTLCGGPSTVQTRVYINDTLVSEIIGPCDKFRAALAEQEPDSEPVAWGMPDADGGILDCIHPEEHAREEGGYTVPLYAHQPRREWQSLTDEEIADAIRPLCGENEWVLKQLLDFSMDEYRAIEAALKEKNA